MPWWLARSRLQIGPRGLLPLFLGPSWVEVCNGDIALHPNRVDGERSKAHYRQALAFAEPRGMRPLVAHCHLGLGKLYQRTGKREQAQEHLATAMTIYRGMGMTYWLDKATKDCEPV